MPLTTYTAGDVLTAASLNSNLKVAGGLQIVKAQTTFTAASSVTVDNVFTSSYTNYRIQIKYQTSTTGDLNMRVRVGGVSASGTNYNWQRIRGDSTTASAARNASTSWEIALASNGAFNSTTIIDIFSPQLAEPTLVTWTNNYNVAAYTTPKWNAAGGNHDLSTAYDGFELLPSSGTATGTYTVYGYNNTL